MIFNRTLTYYRYGAAVPNASGGDDWPSPTSSTLLASVQRPAGKIKAEYLRLRDPAGVRTDDVWYVDTATELRTFNEPAGVPADRIEIVDELGVTVLYEVAMSIACEGPLPHWECTVCRVVEGKQP